MTFQPGSRLDRAPDLMEVDPELSARHHGPLCHTPTDLQVTATLGPKSANNLRRAR